MVAYSEWWSWSMFSRIAASGARRSSERSLSSASAQNHGPSPHAAPVPSPHGTSAPTHTVAPPSASASMAVVVDFPCAPATARPR